MKLPVNLKIVGFLTVVAVAVALSLSISAPAAPPAHPAVPAVSQPAAAAPAASPAPEHPEIREALESLRRARAHMQEAAHDFGGHRVDAIKATDEAIKQLEICLKFDK